MNLKQLALLCSFAALVACGDDTTSSNGGAEKTSGTPVQIGTETYQTVKIGSKTWLAKNVNVATASGSVCYDSLDANCDIYGRLYNHATALTVCPTGWRLPSKDDIENLVTVSGHLRTGALKADSDLWLTNPGPDTYGFAGLPAGGAYIDDESGLVEFERKGEHALFWTATESDFLAGKYWASGFYDSGIGGSGDASGGYADDPSSFHSVRCVK